jgi:hypothetical protein
MLNDNTTRLLESKTPAEYIENSLFLEKWSEKCSITKQWLNKTGYTIKDIQYARNRHPYWKRLKLKNHKDNILIRNEKHSYYSSGHITYWKYDIHKFLEKNKKDRKGKYLYKDWQLAKYFECSIPAIQGMRRKYNMALFLNNGLNPVKKFIRYILITEKELRKLVKMEKQGPID